jgi:hypothetical protein
MDIAAVYLLAHQGKAFQSFLAHYSVDVVDGGLEGELLVSVGESGASTIEADEAGGLRPAPPTKHATPDFAIPSRRG